MNLCSEYALKYLSFGWSVIPVRAGTKKALVKWEPFEKKRPTEEQLQSWWKKWPDAQLAVITGKISGFVAVDFDSPEAVEAFESTICQLPATIRQETGKPNHFHYLFQYPPDTDRLPNFARRMDDVDFRGDGGYILVPPSVHPNGKQYQWMNIDPTEMGLDDLLEMPEDILKFCKEDKKTPTIPDGIPKNKPDWVQDALLGVKEGRRDQTCTKLTGYYIRMFKGDRQQTRDILYSWNLRNEPPLPRKDIDKTVESIGKKHKIIALSDIIGFEIFQVEVIRRDNHDLDYLFYLEAGVAKMASKEVLSAAFFTRKIFEVTGRPPILTAYSQKKRTEWLTAVGDAVAEATWIQASIDETTDEPVIDAINHYILRNPSEDLNRIDSRAVVVKGLIMLKIKAIKNHVRSQGEKITAKEIGAILRNKLKFKSDRVRVGTTQERVWTKPLDEWRW